LNNNATLEFGTIYVIQMKVPSDHKAETCNYIW